jgi:DNA polymerase III subunit epsilon
MNYMATRRLIPERKKVAGLKLTRPIAVIDLETTGTATDADRIVEIGILKVMPDGKTLRFRKRITPGIKIPKEATRVHGITNADVFGKPRFKAVARKIKKFILHCDLAGFNLKTFDLLMLQAEFERAGFDFSCDDCQIIDVKDIYHYHETRTLTDAVRFYCNSSHDAAHSALDDACATWRVLEAQIAKYGLPKSVGKLAEFLQGARPPKYLDSGRWFTTRDGKPVLAKGKHNGVALSQIAKQDPEYLQWILGLGDVPADTKKMVSEKLED